MTYLSIIEKLNILFDTMMDFYFIIVFSVLLMVFTFMYLAKSITIKKYSLLMVLSFIGVFGISIVGNYDVLYNTFDDFTTIFFGNIYFPSIYVYIGVLVVSFIAFVISIFNVMLSKIYKVINSIMFVVNNVLFVVILNIIAKNKIDIFSVQSLYSNTSLVAVLELSMGLFILWIISLIIVYTTNLICINFAIRKVNNEKVKEEIFNPVLEVPFNTDLDVNSLNNEEKHISVEAIADDKIEMVKTNKFIIKDQLFEDNDIENISSITFNDVLNGTIPVAYYDNKYAGNDYNLVNSQNVYEDNNKVKSDITFNDILIDTNIVEEESISVAEELTKIEKEVTSEKNLIDNTALLNDLSVENDNTIEVEDNVYSIEDYKKIIKMLTEIKNYSNGTNININDALAIGLINNYSIDDCIKFKNILENNLN